MLKILNEIRTCQNMLTVSINFSHIKQHRQCTYNVTSRRVHVTTVVVEKQQLLHNLSVSIALVVQRMRRTVLSSVTCLAVRNFSTLSHKRKIKKKY